MFKTYVADNKKVLLESSYTTKVIGIGDMKVRKNLNYRFLLNKTEFTQT